MSMFRIAQIVLLALLSVSCIGPRHVSILDDVLRQEGRRSRLLYSHRCTRGAHRGSSEAHLENTLAAFAAAEADRRFAFIEFDVQYSKDGRIVVFHDQRMLRLFGSLRSIGNTTYAELSKISEGEIATYEEVMSVLRKPLNIEIKSQGDADEDRRLADEVVADLRHRGRQRDVLISSISSEVIRHVKERNPDIRTGKVFWLTSSTYLHFDFLTDNLFAEMKEIGADYLMLHVANLRNVERLLRRKPRGISVVFWDFDDRMYLVHKDLDDRLWGASRASEVVRSLRYRLALPVRSLRSPDR